MKVTLFLVAFLAVFAFALSAVARYPKAPPGKPGFCWSDDTGPMAKGEEKTLKGQCVRAICFGDGTIETASCGVIDSPTGLTEPDLTKEYPDCCPGPK